jgi:hypothetical protein
MMTSRFAEALLSPVELRSGDIRHPFGSLIIRVPAPPTPSHRAGGNRHFAPEGASVQIVDAATGTVADPILVDRATGRPLTEPDYVLVPGPAAGERLRKRLSSPGRSGLLAPDDSPAAPSGPRAKPERAL